MSAQGTAYVCRTSIQGETTHNAHTGPGREEVGGHTMRAVYTQYEGGVLGPQGLHAGRRERQKATRTHAQHMLARHRHTSQHGCTWPHKKREAGGCSGRGTGGLGAGHTDMNAWLFPLSHMCTREQHTALPHRGVARWEGQQTKVETQHKGNRKQYQQGTKQHIRCVTALREERGVWVWVVGDGTCAVLGRSHNRHHRATGFGWGGGRG